MYVAVFTIRDFLTKHPRLLIPSKLARYLKKFAQSRLSSFSLFICSSAGNFTQRILTLL